MKRVNHNMLQGPLFPSIISYTIPVIFTGILQLLFNAADLAVIGRFKGSIYVAAVSATTSLTMLLINLFIGISIGAGVAVAHAIGGKQDDVIHRTVHTAIPTALVSGAVVTIIGVLFSEEFLRFMGTPENVLPLSALYMKIYFSGITFTILYNFTASILRAAGDTKSPLLYLTLAGITNVVLNVLFVTVFDMNVDGVALATVASQIVAALLCLRALMHRQDACRLQLRKMRFYKTPLLKIIRVGLPAGIQSSMFSISNVIIQSSINSFGDVFMSGNGAAASIEGFIYTTFNAFDQATVNFVGQNAGAHQYKRVKKIYLITLSSAVVVTMILGALTYTFGPSLLGIYISDSPQAIQYGMIRFTFIAVPYFLCAMSEMTTAALRGMGASLPPMLITVLGICGIRIVWIFTVFQIPAYHTPQYLYASYPITWVITFTCQLILFFIIYRRRVKNDTLSH